MKSVISAAVSFLFILSTAHAEPAAIFAALDGKWSAKGNAFSPDAEARMTWSETLDGAFHRVDYRIDMTLDGKEQGFEGVGHYRSGDGDSADGYWADSTGDLHPIVAKISETAIVAHWGKAGAKQGRTEYRLGADGAVLVTDWLLTADGWRQFNQATFKKGK